MAALEKLFVMVIIHTIMELSSGCLKFLLNFSSDICIKNSSSMIFFVTSDELRMFTRKPQTKDNFKSLKKQHPQHTECKNDKAATFYRLNTKKALEKLN